MTISHLLPNATVLFVRLAVDFQNHRNHHLKRYISQRVRQLSKFLIILRTLVPELKDFFKPKFYINVEATKKLSGYNEELNIYIHPSML